MVENGVSSFNGSLIGTVLPALFHLVSGKTRQRQDRDKTKTRQRQDKDKTKTRQRQDKIETWQRQDRDKTET